MKNRLFIFVIIGACSCTHISRNQEWIQDILNAKTDSTVILNIMSIIQSEYPLSQLLDTVRYVELDNAEQALLATIKNIKVTHELIYVLDIDDRLKCFDRQGNFIRDAYSKGGGPNEIGHFIDFDVDESYLYILDGAKIALFTFDHDGTFVKKENIPFRAEMFKHLSDNRYLFYLSRFSKRDEYNFDKIVLTDDKFNIIQPVLHYIENTRPSAVYPFFENCADTKFFCDGMGNGLFELKDSIISMKYYLDFDGKYFNTDVNVDGYKLAVEQKIYFAARSPIHNENYILQPFFAGLQRNGTLFIRLKDNKAMFIEKLIEDKIDVISFLFSYTIGYDSTTNEFYGFSNYWDLENIDDVDKIAKISKIREVMPSHVQPFLLRENAEQTTNHILIFYKLKKDIEFSENDNKR
ncbi:hypothetical protein FACS189430_07160 [Bacteroidia bacterium]|nr:hypothetical protein FACS189430_07160 [Bacteroidia bacterium]